MKWTVIERKNNEEILIILWKSGKYVHYCNSAD